MKKFFFLKSSSSHGGEHQERYATRKNRKDPVHKRQNSIGSPNVENKLQISKHLSPDCERKTVSKSVGMRRSRSFTMPAAADDSEKCAKEDFSGLKNRKKFPSSHSVHDCSDCHYQLKDKSSQLERYDLAVIQIPPTDSRACSSPTNPSSPQSSFGSASVSDQVLDLYMDDGDHHREMKARVSDHRANNPTGLHSRYSSKESNFFIRSQSTSRESLRSEHQCESPRKLAKDVVERLLMLEQLRDTKSGDNCRNWPPMVTTVYDKHLDGQSYTAADDISGKGSTLKDILDEDKGSIRNYNSSIDGEYGMFSKQKGDATDSALRTKLEEVKHRAIQLSGELAQGNSIHYYASSKSALSEMVRSLIEEERRLVLEFCDHLQWRINDRANAKEEASLLKEEMNSAIVKLDREKGELKSRLQRELNRRSVEWESKLRELQSEENRLRDRLREVAVQNVSLQRELSTVYNKETEYTDRISNLEAHLEDLIAKMDEARSENDGLQKKLSDLQNKVEAAEEVQSCMERNFQLKGKENSELIKTVSRLRGTCSEQERTIDGLRQCLNSEIEKQLASGKTDNITHKLLMEQSRLTEAEQAVRRQLESCTVELESLRHENIYLLERLRNTGKVSGPSALKLDQELASCVQSLQNVGLLLLNESVQMCEKLIGILGERASPEGFREAYNLMDYDMKVQGFKQGLKQLTRSLRKDAFVLKEKAETQNYKPESSDTNGILNDSSRMVAEDDMMSELKAESLLTSLLKEKLYSKEKEIERVQSELAKALQSHDVLKSEIQGAFDTISCVNHKLKNLELQMIRKDGTIDQLQGKVQSQEEELATTKATLSKVSQERDLMWEEVKQYSEKNMLLNHEVNSLRKKMDALEEDTLLKDGQISILKDSLNNARTFDVLFGPEQGDVFKL